MIKDIVIEAYNFAEKAHEGEMRKYSGLAYFTHPKGVARLLDDLQCDAELVAAGLLHDVLENTDATYDQLVDKFGKRVADVVAHLSNNSQDMKAAGGKRFYLAHKISEELNDDELTVKLADRCHNVIYLEGDSVPKDFIIKYYKETKFILFALEEAKRSLNEVQKALVKRIEAVLEFLRIRYSL